MIATQQGSSWENKCACTPSLTLRRKSLWSIATNAQNVIRPMTLHRLSKMGRLKSSNQKWLCRMASEVSLATITQTQSASILVHVLKTFSTYQSMTIKDLSYKKILALFSVVPDLTNPCNLTHRSRPILNLSSCFRPCKTRSLYLISLRDLERDSSLGST